VLLLLPSKVLPYLIQHITYLSPAGYLVVFHEICVCCHTQTPFKLRISSCLQARTNTLLFPLAISKLVKLGGRHNPLLFIDPSYPLGLVNQHSFPNTCVLITSTAFFSERCVTTDRELA